MKIRRGFVTNSSSTNDIFQALGTAGAAAALGTIINVVKPVENVKLISYALLETTHMPEEPKPPVIRVNDSDYMVWYYAAVRMIDVSIVTDDKTKEVVTTVIRDEYDDAFTSLIKFNIAPKFAYEWLTFATDGAGEGSEAFSILSEGYKVCGFLCESSHNDQPRSQRPSPGSLMSFNVEVTVNGKKLSAYKQTTIRDEAELQASGGYAINDQSVTTKLPMMIRNKDKYTWKLNYEVSDKDSENLMDIDIRPSTDAVVEDVESFDLVIKPEGNPLGTKEKPKRQHRCRIDITGKANAVHLEEVKDYVEVYLVDEGLFFEGDMDHDGFLKIDSFIVETEENDAPEKEIPLKPFKLKCVVKCDGEENDNTAKFIDIFDAEIIIEALKGTDQATNNLAKGYKYEVEKEGSSGDYIFRPKMQLPSSKTPYAVLLPITCKYEGQVYELEMPIHLMGEPVGFKEAWAEEYKKLRIIIRKYIPPEQWIDILDAVNEKKYKLSIEQLRLMRKSIWETARDQLVAEAKGYEQIAVICEWTEFGFKCLKWINDQAFSYVVATAYSPLVEAFLTPFKDVMLNLLGEYSVDFFWGEGGQLAADKIAKGSLSGIFTGFENALMNVVNDNVSLGALDIKKIGQMLAAFAAVKCMNHYFCDTKKDGTPVGLWDAIIDTCKDLTVNLFKTLVTKKFEELAKSDKAQELFSKFATKQIREFLTKLCPKWEVEGVDILAKYLSEFGGLISCEAYGKTVAIAGSNRVTVTADDTVLSFNLSSDPKKPLSIKLSLNSAKESLYNYMFNSMFSKFPFAPDIIELTDDPTYYKK